MITISVAFKYLNNMRAREAIFFKKVMRVPQSRGARKVTIKIKPRG